MHCLHYCLDDDCITAVKTVGKDCVIISLSNVGVYWNERTCYDYYPTENLNILIILGVYFSFSIDLLPLVQICR